MSLYDTLIQRGKIEGKIEGEVKGEIKTINSVALNLFDAGMTIEFIANVTNKSVSEITDILKSKGKIV